VTTIALVAGEHSGDVLAAGLIGALRERLPEAVFEGVAGPRMVEAGCRPLLRTEELAVMGMVEVLGHLGRLLRIRRRLIEHFTAHPPDVFIGIDSPDFNLNLEARLRAAGIRTVHYVSPTVWAWRRGRVRKVARAVDLLLALFPFEVQFYENLALRATAVGHPLADEIPLRTDRAAARARLGLAPERSVIALLPGSRLSEVRRLGEAFAGTAAWVAERRTDVRFIAAMASPSLRDVFEGALRRISPELKVTLSNGDARAVVTASDVVLTASGTATLEALLLKRPMVVAYRVAALSYHLAKDLRLVKVKRIALPNLLAGENLVEEFIQNDVVPPRLGPAILRWLDEPWAVRRLQNRFDGIHRDLRRNASARAANAVLGLLDTAPGVRPAPGGEDRGGDG
jgi:lipid-A-disaccharide synthase